MWEAYELSNEDLLWAGNHFHGRHSWAAASTLWRCIGFSSMLGVAPSLFFD